MNAKAKHIGIVTLLRVITALSVTFGLFWAAGLITDVYFGFDIGLRVLVIILATGVLCLVVLPAFLWPSFMKPHQETSTLRILATLAGFSIAAYVLLVPVFGVLGWVMARTSQIQSDPQSQAKIAIAFIALWMPIWWAPGFGALASWIVLRAPRGIGLTSA